MKKLLIAALLISGCFAQPPMVRGTLGSGYVLLGKLASANMNVTTDQAITITIPSGATKYCIQQIIATNASTSLTLAAGGIYPAASKGGTPIVAAAQVYSALTGASVVLPLTIATTATNTQTTLYLSLTAGQGGAATADIYVFGVPLP